MKQMNKCLLMILCLFMCLSVCSGFAYAEPDLQTQFENAQTIADGETKTVTILNPGDEVCYVFTAPESEAYTLTIDCSDYTRIRVYQENGDLLYDRYDNWPWYNCSFNQDEVYYFVISYDSENTGSFSFNVMSETARMAAWRENAENAEPINDGETKNAYIQKTTDEVFYSFTPSISQNYRITIDTESLAEVNVYDIDRNSLGSFAGYPGNTYHMDTQLEAGSVYYFVVSTQEGKNFNVQIKLQSEALLKQELLQAFQNAEAIESGTTAEVNITTGGETVYFRFIPSATETYYFSSDSNNEYLDTYGYIYDSNGGEISFDDDNGSYGNFKISQELLAGETYYLAARFYSNSKTGSFTVSLMNLAQKKADWQTKVQVAQPINVGDQFSVTTNAKDILYFSFTPDANDRYIFWSNYYEVYLFDDAGEEINIVNSHGGSGVTTHEYDLVAGEMYYYSPRVYYNGTEDPSQVELTITVKLTSLGQKLAAMQQSAEPVELGESVTLTMGTEAYVSFIPTTSGEYTFLVQYSRSKNSMVCSAFDSTGNEFYGNDSSGEGIYSFTPYLNAGETYFLSLESLMDMGEVSVIIIDSSDRNTAIENAVELSFGETVTIPSGETRYFKVTSDNEDYFDYYFFSKNKTNSARVIRHMENNAYLRSVGFYEGGDQYSYLYFGDYSYGDTNYYSITCGECLNADVLELTVLRKAEVNDLLEIESTDGQNRYIVPKGEKVNLAVKVSPEWIQPALSTLWSSYTTWTEEDTINRTYYAQNKNSPSYDPFRFETGPVNENSQYLVETILNGYEKLKAFEFYVDYERADGYTGDQVTWALSPDGTTLTLSGSGEMWDYFGENGFLPPWSQQVEGVTQVLVGDGITSIGSYAFQNMTNLTDVTLPNTITHIDSDAFTNCLSLKTILLPTSLREIRRYAFYGSGLESIVLPDGVSSLSTCAFMGCSSLTTVEISESVISIGSGCFAGCEAITSIMFLGDAPSIESDAFSGVTADACYYSSLSGWTEAVMNNYGGSLTWKPLESGDSSTIVFSENLALENVSCEYVEGGDAYNQGSVGRLRINVTVTGPADIAEVRIAGWMYNKPTADSARQMAENTVSVWKQNESSFSERELPYELQTNRPVFEEDLGNTQYIILVGLDTGVNFVGFAVIETNIPDGAVSFNVSFDTNGGSTLEAQIVKNGEHANKPSNPTKEGFWFVGWFADTSLSVPYSFETEVTEDTILYAKWAEPDLVLPAELNFIDEEAFSGGAFTFVKLPENMEQIGALAFANCPNLVYIYIPTTAQSIHEDAFGDIQGLTILGIAGSVAESYALTHSYEFIDVS